jgi:hypothetical protein
MGDTADSRGRALPGDRAWEPGEFTELRVHGVGNTALLWLLDDPDPKQVAGDEIAGFYRSRADRPLVVDPGSPDETHECVDDTPRRDVTLPQTESTAATGEGQDEDWRDNLRWTDVEAYDWGGFNTGGGWKAMWLFLLPFSLTNVAGWLVAGRSKWGQKWVRLLAMGTSLFFVTWLGALAIHLIALQCGWQEACYNRQLFLKPYGLGIFDNPSSRVAPALIVPLAVAWVLWMWPGRKSQRRYEAQQPESKDKILETMPADQRPTKGGGTKSWLRNPNVWARDSEVHLDASLHVVAILATLGGCVAWANWTLGGLALDLVLSVVGGALLIAAAGVVVGWSPFAGRNTEVGEDRVVWTRWLIWLAMGFMVVVVATLFVDRGYGSVDWASATLASSSGEPSLESLKGLLDDVAQVQDEADRFSGSMRDALFLVNGAVLGFSLFGLTVVALKTGRDDARRNRRLWSRWGPIVAGLTGLAMAATLVSGAGLWLEEWLGDRPSEHLAALGVDESGCGSDKACALVPVGEIEDLSDLQATLAALVAEADDLDALPLVAHIVQRIAPRNVVLAQPVVELPHVYDLAALGFLALLVVMLIWVGVLEIRLRRLITVSTYPVRKALVDLSKWVLDGRTQEERDAWTMKGVKEMRKSPRLTRIHGLFLPPTFFMLAFGLFLLIDGLVFHFENTEGLLEWVAGWGGWLFTVAQWLITAAVIAVATFVYRSYKPEAQEPFGGMWDVISFLPRHYHPFAVPSYGLRAVPELAKRITYLCETRDGKEGRCLVSAHSGGVVISLAAIALLDEKTQGRVSLVTYGSPTGALYGRAYPEYFDTTRLVEDVAYHLGDTPGDVPDPDEVRWLNLWRFTDWTGGYSFGPAGDRFEEYAGSATPESQNPFVDSIEWLQFDPACDTLCNAPGFDPAPRAIGHTDYLHDPKHIGAEDPRYQRVRGTLLQMLA